MIRSVLVALLLIHGLIHLMGLKEAGNPFKNGSIKDKSGLLWLLATMLFLLSGIFLFIDRDWWFWAIPAIILSQVLITTVLTKARAGTVANLIILPAAVINIASARFNERSQKQVRELLAANAENTAVTYSDPSTLPAPVRNWIIRSGASVRRPVNTVHLYQQGMMRTSSDGSWKSMKAEQYFTTASPSFIWLADIDYGITHVAGRDTYNKGNGSMLISMASLIPIVNASGPQTDQGAMLRYLAEIQWFPTAALNTNIQWQAVDSLSARATMMYNGAEATGIFHFNKEGDVTGFEAKRYMEDHGSYSLETWCASVTAYKVFDGLRIPAEGSVTWKLKKGDFEWFRWQITDISYNEAPAAAGSQPH